MWCILFYYFTILIKSFFQGTVCIAHVMKACKNTEIRKKKKLFSSQRYWGHRDLVSNLKYCITSDVSKITQTLPHRYMVAQPIQSVNVKVMFHGFPVWKETHSIHRQDQTIVVFCFKIVAWQRKETFKTEGKGTLNLKQQNRLGVNRKKVSSFQSYTSISKDCFEKCKAHVWRCSCFS